MRHRPPTWVLAISAGALGLVALVLGSAGAGTAGWHVSEPPEFECFVHLPEGWGEATVVTGEYRWWPPGTECRYEHPSTGEVQAWSSPPVRASVLLAVGGLAGGGATVAAAVAVRRGFQPNRRAPQRPD